MLDVHLLDVTRSSVLQVVCSLVFRQYALMENAINYSLNPKKHTIEQRLTWSRDRSLEEKVNCTQAKHR